MALAKLYSRGLDDACDLELPGRSALAENRSAPTPPAAPETVAPGTVAVDLTKAYDPNEFHKDVTQDQRIHVHIDFGRVFESHGNSKRPCRIPAGACRL